MNTFFLNMDIEISASQLDSRRLNKQITEAMQIYNADFRNGPSPGNPYSYEMWQDYPRFLIQYGVVHYHEWQQRFVRGDRGGQIAHKSGAQFVEQLLREHWEEPIIVPDWLTEELCSNHRSIMLGKTVEAYYRVGTEVWETIESCNLTGEQKRILDDIEWYDQFGWKETAAERILVNGKLRWPYIWPTEVRENA